MSSPKLQRIIDTIAARAATILVADGFYSDIGLNVLRDRREPHGDDMPCLVVFMNNRVASDVQNKRQKCAQTVTVAGYRVLADGEETETIGIEILSDIQTAVEAGDEKLGNLLQGTQYGMTYESDQIFMPDMGGSAVCGQVTYAIPHIRKSGDPEIA